MRGVSLGGVGFRNLGILLLNCVTVRVLLLTLDVDFYFDWIGCFGCVVLGRVCIVKLLGF